MRSAVHCRRPRGFSLIELMVAMVLGLFLMSGMIAVFAGNKRSSELNAAMSNLQESARFALDRMASDIRLAGFQGCPDMNRSSRMPAIADDPVTTDLRATATTAALVESATSWSPSAPNGFDVTAAGATVGTHALSLQFGGPVSRRLLSPQLNAGAPDPSVDLLLADGSDLPDFTLATDDLAIISTCNQVEVFRVTSASKVGSTLSVGHSAAKNSTGSFTRAYGYADDPTEQTSLLDETRVMRLNANIYYVADTGQSNEFGDGIRALYRQSLPYDDPDNPPTEIVQGVEQMRVSFGIADGLQGLRYVTPEEAGYDPTRVETVRIGLLMASWDRISDADDTNTYLLAGQAVSPPGGDSNVVHGGGQRFRLPFNTTVKVRNRRR